MNRRKGDEMSKYQSISIKGLKGKWWMLKKLPRLQKQSKHWASVNWPKTKRK